MFLTTTFTRETQNKSSKSNNGKDKRNTKSQFPEEIAKILTFLFFISSLFLSISAVEPPVYSNHFAVHLPTGDDRAQEIADKHGYDNRGQIGSLKNYYLFEHKKVHKRSLEHNQEHHDLLTDEPDIAWFEQQYSRKRVKRDFSYYEGNQGGGPFFSSPHSFLANQPHYQNQLGFIDPLFKEQWYLTAGSKDGFDMNVQGAWKKGYTGKGVVVSILDDGIQTNHPDLIANYDPRASTDINDSDNDPTPQDNGDNKHGTRCAGEVSATAGNSVCGVGIAYNASIGGVRMLDGTVNDAVEAKALGLNPDHIDIYSASWGPEGKTVDGPGPLARRAFIYGVTNGRRGLGSIFIWASGNGGRHVDSCNCDGYTNSIFTLSISSATQGGYKPWYLEECASTLATTYSSGTPTLDKSVATVDMDGRLRPDFLCTVEHTGTSASAPIAAGIVALTLEANPNLSWRDIQYLTILSSRPDPLEKEEGWYVNGVSRKFSHKFGFGLMDAEKMVDLAEKWSGIPSQHICKSREIREDREIPGFHLGKVKVFMDVDGCAQTNSEIRYLEHVQCKISLRFFPRGNLRILLTSPSGTTSVLLFERPRDVSSSNFDDWPFLSVHFWGEQASGRWTLEIVNSGSRRINQPGILKKWQLILYGTDSNPVRLKGRSLPLHNSQQSFQTPLTQTHPQYRQVDTQGQFPRFVPQDYLYHGASERNEQYEKPQSTRSQGRKSCYEYWISDLNICLNSCPDGYYTDNDSRECNVCINRCKTCYNGTSCTSCEHNLVLFDTSCLSTCPEGYYEADSSCEKCQLSTCASCAAFGNECVRCKTGLYLFQNNCVKTCPAGFYPTAFNECTNCAIGCHSCNSETCYKCADGYKLNTDNNACVEENPSCPSGMFYNGKQCSGCGNEDCERCIGVGQCIQCRNKLKLYRGECYATCEDGLYTAPNNKECFKCPSLCTKCTNSNECNECRGDALIQGGQCLPRCSDGYFNDVGSCSLCSSACKTCIGASESECVQCNKGFIYSKGDICRPEESQSQESSNLDYTPSDASPCSDGLWFNKMNVTCEPCHYTCSKCNGGNAFNCRSCIYPYKLDRGSSRCISCCKGQEEHDCCHCENKRHAHMTKDSEEYNDECHFVSRRVSESEEREISSKWNDSLVLSFFWLSVFIVILGMIISYKRRQRKTNMNMNLSNNLLNYYQSQKCQNSNKSYIPLSLRDEDLLNPCDEEEEEEEEEEESLEFELRPSLSSANSEGVPLVLKT